MASARDVLPAATAAGLIDTLRRLPVSPTRPGVRARDGLERLANVLHDDAAPRQPRVRDPAQRRPGSP